MGVNTDTIDDLINQIQTNTERNQSANNYPAQLARDTGYTRTAVQQSIKWLEKWGLVEREPYTGDGLPPRRIVILNMDTFTPGERPEESLRQLLTDALEKTQL